MTTLPGNLTNGSYRLVRVPQRGDHSWDRERAKRRETPYTCQPATYLTLRDEFTQMSPIPSVLRAGAILSANSR